MDMIKALKFNTILCRRILAAFLTAVLALSCVVTVTLAWSDLAQAYRNTMTAPASPVRYTAELVKTDRDTEEPIPGAEFYLFTDEDEQAGGRLVTDADGKITVTGLTSGGYYFLETRPAYGYAQGEAPRYPFTLGEDLVVTVHAQNTRLRAPLTITKNLQNADGSDLTPEQRETEFEFAVTIGGETETIHLKHGQQANYDLPVGTMYLVTEAPMPGHVTQSNNHQGTITAQGRVAEFINTHSETPVEPRDGSLAVTKTIEGETPAHADLTFQFVLEMEGEDPVEFSLKPGDSRIFPILEGRPYTLRELDLPENYALVQVQNGSGTAAGHAVAEFTNAYTGVITVEITGEKTWEPNDIDLPESVTLRLKNGDTLIETAEAAPEEAGRWLYSFEAPKYDHNGELIEYAVEEMPLASWRPVYDPDSYDVKNIYVEPIEKIINAQKIVAGEPPGLAQFRFLLTGPDCNQAITIAGAGECAFAALAFTGAGTYEYVVSEANTGADGYVYDESIYTVIFVIEEEDNMLAVVSETYTKDGEPADEIVFENEYAPGHTNVGVTKIWQGGGEHPGSVQAQLYKDGTAHGDPVTLNADNGWKHVWTDLEKDFAYTVDEIDVPQGYTKSVSGDAVNGFIITNSRDERPETASVTVQKTWNDKDNPDRPRSVAVRLYRDGVIHGGPVTLTAANGWAYTWAGLEAGPAWTVDEPNVPTGYAKKISGDAVNGFVITNTRAAPPSGKISVSGTKTWAHGGNPEDQRPKSIVLHVKADGVIVLQKEVTAADNWSWSLPFDKYGPDGREIVYTIDEAPVSGYTKTIDGHNLHNAYEPPEPPDPNKPGEPEKPFTLPKTSDNSNALLWIALTALSFTGLAAVLFQLWRQRKQRALAALLQRNAALEAQINRLRNGEDSD